MSRHTLPPWRTRISYCLTRGVVSAHGTARLGSILLLCHVPYVYAGFCPPVCALTTEFPVSVACKHTKQLSAPCSLCTLHAAQCAIMLRCRRCSIGCCLHMHSLLNGRVWKRVHNLFVSSSSLGSVLLLLFVRIYVVGI